MTEFLRRHSFAAAVGALLFLALYALPVFAEYLLLRLHVSAFLCCVILSDLPGAAVLYAMGFRRSAIAVWGGAAIVEEMLFLYGMPPTRLIWLTNIAPALGAAAIVFALNSFEKSLEE